MLLTLCRLTPGSSTTANRENVSCSNWNEVIPMSKSNCIHWFAKFWQSIAQISVHWQMSFHLDPMHAHLANTSTCLSKWKTTTKQCGMHLMSLKVKQHLLWASTSQTDRYGQKIHSRRKTSCFPQMLLTDDSCWAISKPPRRKESSRFAPDRVHKGFQAAGPGIQLRLWEARESHLEGQHRQNNSSSTITSLWIGPLSCRTLLMRIGCVCRVIVNPHRQQMPACLPHLLNPL